MPLELRLGSTLVSCVSFFSVEAAHDIALECHIVVDWHYEFEQMQIECFELYQMIALNLTNQSDM